MQKSSTLVGSIPFGYKPTTNASFKKASIAATFITFLLLSTSVIGTTFAAPTLVKVDPASYSVMVGDSFNSNVTVTDVVSLAGWEFKLFFKRSILNCSSIAEGPFLSSAGSTFRVFEINNTYNATHGRVLAGCAILGYNVSKSGSGTLATIAFRAIGQGNSALDLVDTKLAGSGDPPPAIPHSTFDGTVNVGGTGKPGDVNGDGKVNVLDLISVAGKLGWIGPPGSIPQDQNSDGRVNVLDLIFVAGKLGT